MAEFLTLLIILAVIGGGVGLYRRHGAAWARDRGDAMPELGWLRRFAALLPAGHRHVLDLGCGAGRPIARWLMGKGVAVTGVDAAPEMIALCRCWCPKGDWQVADMRGLALGRRFGGVLAWDSFFHLDQEAQAHARLAAEVAALDDVLREQP